MNQDNETTGEASTTPITDRAVFTHRNWPYKERFEHMRINARSLETQLTATREDISNLSHDLEKVQCENDDLHIKLTAAQAVMAQLESALTHEIKLAEKQVELLDLRIEEDRSKYAVIAPFRTNIIRMVGRLTAALAAYKALTQKETKS
jgi:dGTP triphosphohydrolase